MRILLSTLLLLAMLVAIFLGTHAPRHVVAAPDAPPVLFSDSFHHVTSVPSVAIAAVALHRSAPTSLPRASTFTRYALRPLFAQLQLAPTDHTLRFLNPVTHAPLPTSTVILPLLI